MGARWKRDQKNKENLRLFFTSMGADGRKSSKALSLGSPEFILKLIYLCRDHSVEVEHLLQFARRYKQTVSELTADDVKEVQDLMVVREVLET